MSEIPSPQPEFDEVLSRFPELARARSLFIELFKDRSPLINLGYTSRQVEFALPVLRLLEEEGGVMDHLRDPYLTFDNPRDSWVEALEVYYLPSRQGFYLSATRDETARGWDDLTEVERLWRMLYTQNPVIIFSDFSDEIAHIGLFDETADVTNLDYLIREFYADSFTNAPEGMRREGKLTKIARAIGIAGTYRATWVDDETKLEFVAKLDAPEYRQLGSDYVAYRRLRPISDNQGTVVPFGKKANVFEQKVTKILSAQKQQIVSGQLSWGKAGI